MSWTFCFSPAVLNSRIILSSLNPKCVCQPYCQDPIVTNKQAPLGVDEAGLGAENARLAQSRGLKAWVRSGYPRTGIEGEIWVVRRTQVLQPCVCRRAYR